MKSPDELFDEQLRPLLLLSRVRRELAHLPGVVAVGIGFRRTAGSLSEEITFRVYVERKRATRSLPAAQRIPRLLHGVPTDVEQVAASFVSLTDVIDPLDYERGPKVSTLVGGVEIDSDLPDGFALPGTLGCFAQLRSDPTVKVLLTNSHVLYGPNEDPTKPGRLVGQTHITSSSCCKTGVIGKALRGVPEGLVDAAIATLHGKRPIDQRLPGIGPDMNGRNENLITGVPKPMLEDADVDQNPATPRVKVFTSVLPGETVRKVGKSTGPTTGVVTDIGYPLTVLPGPVVPKKKLYTEQILIRPESGGEGADGRISFGTFGDSGSVVVNRFNQVVALLHTAAPNPDDPRNRENFFMWGAASQIHHVSDLLEIDVFASSAANRNGIPDTVVPMNAIVPGTGIMSRAMTHENEARGAVLDEVVEHLQQSDRGRLILRLYDAHHRELRALLDHDRQVKVAWHRNRGPAFVARLLSGLRGLDQPVPKDIEGVSIESGLRRVIEVFMQRGSEALRTDATLYAPTLLELAAKSTTIRDALERVHAEGLSA